MTLMYLKALVCKALFREFSYYASLSDNTVDITFFEWGLHDKVGALSKVLQDEIDRIDSGNDIHTSYPPYDLPFDGILIGYGLCSNGVVGLSSQKYPLVIPRAHDCITLLLGSKERYDKEFTKAKGTFWLSPGWIESSRIPGRKDRQWLFETFCEKHDKRIAEKLVELNDTWMDAYTRLAVIEWPVFSGKTFLDTAKVTALEGAEYVGLSYEILKGNSGLVQDLFSGHWDAERFLVVPPGKTIKASYDENVITY